MKEWLGNLMGSLKWWPARLFFRFISRYECVQLYWDNLTFEEDRAHATRNHINWALFLSVLTSLTGFIHPWFLFLYLIAFLCHSPLMELWFQYYKEKNKFVWNVMAQMIERGIVFLFFLPLPITILVVTLVFDFKLI